jgi:hypothetical protein
VPPANFRDASGVRCRLNQQRTRVPARVGIEGGRKVARLLRVSQRWSSFLRALFRFDPR